MLSRQSNLVIVSTDAISVSWSVHPILKLLNCFLGITSAFCKEQNLVSSKIGARIVIRGILGLPIDVEAIPEGDSNGIDTIVEARPVRVVDGVEIEYYVDG